MLDGLIGGLSRWLENEPSGNKRCAPRVAEPSLLVYYWDGSIPEGRRIRDISNSGAYIITPERWYVGTIVRLTLQGYRTTPEAEAGVIPSLSISIPVRVMRHGPDGVGVEFIFSKPEEREALRSLVSTIPQAPEARAGSGGNATKGQALLEFALILPTVFLLIVNAVNSGAFFFAWITVANRARTAQLK